MIELKKVAVVFLAFALLILFSAVPVMAKTEKVSATISFNPTDYVYGRAWETKGGVFQERGSALTFEILDLSIGGYHHSGVLGAVLSDMLNFKTLIWVGHFDVVLTLDGSTDNGFVGNWEMKQDLNDNTYAVHCVLQGFGVYDRQTLFFAYDGPQGFPAEWTGYCLKG